jgi:surfactin synthase thioesterase subunit
MTDPYDPWILRRRSVPEASIRLFCFPYAGAGTTLYASWPDHLLPSIEVCAVRLPGRECRQEEPAATRIVDLTEQICRGLIPWLDKPFAFFGHSFGALLAFEAVRQLRRNRLPAPSHLLLAARAAPHLPPLHPPLHQLDDHQFLDEVIAVYGGVPRQILAEPEFVRRFLPILRADFEAIETYHCAEEPPLQSPITVIGGRDDALEESHLAAWASQTDSRFSLRMVAGDHFFLQSNQTALLSLLKTELAAAGPPQVASVCSHSRGLVRP